MQISDFKTLVLVADNVHIDKQKINYFSREVDRAYKSNVSDLKEGFENLFESVIVYDDPQIFMQKAHLHKADIIFPYWHGQSSRNKQALIASVCEIEKLQYIGPDTYTNIVCSDKVIAKDICRLSNVNYPKFKVLDTPVKVFEWPYNYPVVVKPVYEGSSLGMTQDNIIFDNNGIIQMVERLFTEFKQPILIEEFIGGTEVNVAIVGWKNHIKVWSAAERIHTKDPSFFNNHLFAFKEKNLDNDIVLSDGRYLFTEEMLQGIFALFNWLDKIEYVRIDGKIFSGKFYCLEITQDADLDPGGSFFTQLKYAGYDFNAALKLLVENCLERYNNLNPNQS